MLYPLLCYSCELADCLMIGPHKRSVHCKIRHHLIRNIRHHFILMVTAESPGVAQPSHMGLHAMLACSQLNFEL